jgi:hypothetical protein
MKMKYTVATLAMPLLMLTACAYNRPESVTAQMARTEAVISQADSAGAKESALPELEQARNKYEQARVELRRDSEAGDRTAVRLAKEAEADAQFAQAKAQAAKQQAAAQEVQQGVQALSDEAQRNAATPPPAVSVN